MKAFSFGGKKPTVKKVLPVAAFSEDADDKKEKEKPKQAPSEPADDDVDPLDAFMATNQRKGQEELAKKAAAPKAADRFADEEDDPETAYYIALEKKKAQMAAQALQGKSAADLAAELAMSGGHLGGGADVDSDEEVYGTAKAIRDAEKAANVVPSLKTAMEELSGVDHSQIEYTPFEKCFYEEDPEIFAMTEVEVMQLRRSLDVRVQGDDPPRPVRSFQNVHLPATVAKDVIKHGYSTPTPIQAQALPAALMGRDVLGIAKTGSGKTAAFLLPMMVHVLDQDFLAEKEGPIGLVLAPTRELCQQIFVEARKFSKSSEIHVAGCYGGASKNEQRLDLLKGAEVVVATPGRFIDMVFSKATNCHRVTYLVLDEADRMLDMGFEPQIRCIMEMVRPDRQTLLFSATFKKRIRELADRLLDAPVHVVVGSIGEASADVHQVVKVLADEGGKWGWLMQTLPGMVDDGEVIIFVSTRVAAEELATNLVKFNFRAASLHGEKQQRERDSIFTDFKKGKVQVLVATDVAARGLDVPTIRNVICFDPARDKDSHTHRIGRTGRAGEQGCAYSLVTQAQPQTASFLVRSLMEVGQPISEDLLKLAEKDGQFNQRAPGAGRGAGRGRGGGRGGFGVGSRGGLGGGGRTAGRGRGGGFGLGFKAENPNFEGGGERMASLGLATATGSGATIAKNRLISDFKSSFQKADVVNETVSKGGVFLSPNASSSTTRPPPPPSSSFPPPPSSSFPPPPPSSSFPPPPPSHTFPPPPSYGMGGAAAPAAAGRGRGMTEPSWKKHATAQADANAEANANAAAALLHEMGGGGAGVASGAASSQGKAGELISPEAADFLARIAARKRAEEAAAGGGNGSAVPSAGEGQGEAKKRRTRWDS